MNYKALLLTMLVVTALSASSSPSMPQAPSRCNAAQVHYTPYPGKSAQLSTIPWVQGTPSDVGLVGLLWYWPENWTNRGLRKAWIFTGGLAPAGYSTKILWVFLSPSAKRAVTGGSLVVQGQRLDGSGRSWQRFAEISYEGQNGAPSFASIIKLSTPGCWRLRLTAGSLRAIVIMKAVRPNG